jgi:formylglycine-generating enzyme required for sulfatase activity
MKYSAFILLFLFATLHAFAQKPVLVLKDFEKSITKTDDKLFMSKYEVTNLQYLAFLESLKDEGKNEIFGKANIDSMRWQDKAAYNTPYIDLYHRHPAYYSYPVVNISCEGAVLFCEWLTGIYNAYEKRKYKKVVFRLPSKEEWIYAARGGLSNNKYPWAGFYLTDYKGNAMCNYRSIGDEWIHHDLENQTLVILEHSGNPDRSSASGDITAPVTLYKPNGYGLYNMSGNASEMISEKGIAMGGSYKSPGYDVRIESSETYSHPNTHIGFRFCMEVLEYW